MSKAVVLLSGGLDSCVCATLAAKEHGAENVIAATLFYGQKHAIELEAAKSIASELSLGQHIVMKLPDIFKGSALTDADKEIPSQTYQEALQVGPVPTVVPNRNMNFLAVATTIAMVEGADYIYYGAHAEDARAWAHQG